MRTIGAAYELLGYGHISAYERKRRSAEPPHALPSGELHPPIEFWIQRHRQARLPSERSQIIEQARSELAAWKRRPDPPPEGESHDEMVDRLITIGEGWSVADVALAFRTTPRLVRRWRIERERNPDTGREEGSIVQARELLAAGHTLRQVAMLTGIPKSTLHEALDRAA